VNDDLLTVQALSAINRFAVSVFLAGAAMSAIAFFGLYWWWFVAAVRRDRRRSKPRPLSGRERARAGEPLVRALTAIPNSVDRSRLGDALVREPRRRRRVRVLVPMLTGLGVGGAVAATLVLALDSTWSWYVNVVLLASLGTAMAVLIATTFMVVRAYKLSDRRTPLTGAAVSVARIIRPTSTQADASQYDLRTGRVEDGRRVRDAFARAGIPEGDLGLLHQLVAQDDVAWQRMSSESMRQLARAYRGDFLAAPESVDALPALSWWARRSAAVLAGVTLLSALAGLASRLLAMRGEAV